jgi:ABC-type tungstate transport system permease subunit
MLRYTVAALVLIALGTSLVLAACAAQPDAATGPQVLRLATTTSTADSGLLDAILPDFEAECGCACAGSAMDKRSSIG